MESSFGEEIKYKTDIMYEWTWTRYQYSRWLKKDQSSYGPLIYLLKVLAMSLLMYKVPNRDIYQISSGSMTVPSKLHYPVRSLSDVCSGSL